MAFVDKRVQLANNLSVTAGAAPYAIGSDVIDLGLTPALRGQAVEGCYLVISVRSQISTTDPNDTVLIELVTTSESAGGSKIVHWSAGNLDLANIANFGPTASSLVPGWMYVVPLSHKATYLRYLAVGMVVNATSSVFESGSFDAYITSTPPFSSVDLMPQGFNAKV